MVHPWWVRQSMNKPAYRVAGLEMDNLQFGPLAGKALSQQPAVALIGRRFTTQQAADLVKKERASQRAGDIPLIHQGLKVDDVTAPIAVSSIGFENLLAGSQLR